MKSTIALHATNSCAKALRGLVLASRRRRIASASAKDLGCRLTRRTPWSTLL